MEGAGSDQTGQELLDEERVAVAVGLHEIDDLAGRARRGETQREHLLHGPVIQRRDAYHRSRIPAPEASDELVGGAIVTAGHHAEDRLGPESVREVIEHGKRLGVGPVHVLEQEDGAGVAAVRDEQAYDRLGEEHG